MVIPKIGQIIKDVRQRKGLMSKELAKKAGIKPSWLSAIENDKTEPRLSTLNAILKALGLPTIEQLIKDASMDDIELHPIWQELNEKQRLELRGYIQCLLKK